MDIGHIRKYHYYKDIKLSAASVVLTFLQIAVFVLSHKLLSAQPTIPERLPGYPREHSLMTDFQFHRILKYIPLCCYVKEYGALIT